jgi:hypothetical protein
LGRLPFVSDLIETQALLTAKAAAEIATQDEPDPRVVFASVGCDWVDVRAIARRSARAIVDLLREEIFAVREASVDASDAAALLAGGSMDRGELLRRIEETWLNGMLVGLFLADEADRTPIDRARLVIATAAIDREGSSLSERLQSLGIDPDDAAAVASSVGAAAQRLDGEDQAYDLGWSLSQAGVWLDGVMVAVRARAV